MHLKCCASKIVFQVIWAKSKLEMKDLFLNIAMMSCLFLISYIESLEDRLAIQERRWSRNIVKVGRLWHGRLYYNHESWSVSIVATCLLFFWENFSPKKFIKIFITMVFRVLLVAKNVNRNSLQLFASQDDEITRKRGQDTVCGCNSYDYWYSQKWPDKKTSFFSKTR